MAIPLLILLLGGYLTVGLVAKDYNWRTRAIILLITLFGPAWFYVFW